MLDFSLSPKKLYGEKGYTVAIFNMKKSPPKAGENKFSGRRVRVKSGSKPGKIGANAWEQMGEQGVKDTMAYRDVHQSQQLRRGEMGAVKGYRVPEAGAVLAGIFSAFLLWVTWGLIGWAYNLAQASFGSSAGDEVETANSLGVPSYYRTDEVPMGNGPLTEECYTPLGPDGTALSDQCTTSLGSISRPDWHVDMTHEAMAAAGMPIEQNGGYDTSFGSWMLFGQVSLLRVLLALIVGIVVYLTVRTVLRKQMDARNLMYETEDINHHKNDQHIALPEETVERYGHFPDVGAHSPVQPSSMISHIMLEEKGVKKTKLTTRADEDIYDSDGDLVYLEGEALLDDDGEVESKDVSMIDTAFGDELFSASGLPKDKTLRRKFDARKITYNPGGKNRDKYGSQMTLAEHINEEWEFPEYEVQRPAGTYVVDEAPVNTMVLAITRAGKGQTYIEPMIDMWLRELRPNNMVINDPKGELLVKNYVRAAKRGFQVVQFNLINALKTDIYNPLGMAAEAAREGDSTKTAMYVENIAEVFFPVDGADDPVWPSAANNAFKRTAYGMIDFYLEEERQMRKKAAAKGWDPKVLETRIDKMWGKVTLFNCYQFFVQLSAKKRKNPVAKVQEDVKKGIYGEHGTEDFREDEASAAMDAAERQMPLWNGEEELDLLTLFFNATDQMPKNTMRTLVGNADKSLRAMGAAEKMLASVYGIAITAMSFFTDPTISTLTSGTPSQNVDLGGLSFPRRMGVRFDANYVAKFKLTGTQVRWDAFSDPQFTKNLGKDFEHEDTIGREGWARYYFKGKFDQDVAYIRLRVYSNGTDMLLKTYYFKFVKGYQTNLRGQSFIKDPVNGTKIVKDGLLTELVKDEASGKFIPGDTMFTQPRLNVTDLTPEELQDEDSAESKIKQIEAESKAITTPSVRYSEQPKVVFLVTPPHLMKYSKLILILVKQLVDLNFDKSYMTKSNQKPLYKTRFMLDELGNLQSEGHGISGFETMLSIGLGQEQQFTLILQTLQQLRDVYGESVDKIVQGNASNIVFLKSTDDTMLDTLVKLSGTRHVVNRDSKTVTKDVKDVIGQVDGKVSYTSSTKEEPVISFNDLVFLSERNSIVFRAGDPPVWNRNETILPMSWRLFKDTITQPGKEYSLQTIPTLSSAADFDVRLNQPDFAAMLEKRMDQAIKATTADHIFRSAYDYSDFDVAQLDPDVMANDVMDIVDMMISRDEFIKTQEEKVQAQEDSDYDDHMGQVGDVTDMMAPPPPSGVVDEDDMDAYAEPDYAARARDTEKITEANTDINDAVLSAQKRRDRAERKIYAEGQISRDMLIDELSTVSVDALDAEDQNALKNAPVLDVLDLHLVKAYSESYRKFPNDPNFRVSDDGSLWLVENNTLLMKALDESSELAAAKGSAADPESRTYAEGAQATDTEELSELNKFQPTAEFKRYLASLDSWTDIAGGSFDAEMAKVFRQREDESMV